MMEEEINQAIELLVKNGFELQSYSTSIEMNVTKLSLELTILPTIAPMERHLRKIAFENAWWKRQTP